MKILAFVMGAKRRVSKIVLANFLLLAKSVIAINSMKDLMPVTWWEKLFIAIFAFILLGAWFFIIITLYKSYLLLP